MKAILQSVFLFTLVCVAAWGTNAEAGAWKWVILLVFLSAVFGGHFAKSVMEMER